MTSPPRVNYDAIAHLYDTQPYRAKSVDPELLAFVAQRSSTASLCLLDIGCGTGNQLLANRAIVPQARLVGVDRSLGMLRQARGKAADIVWVQADGAALSWQAQRFDFITCQYAFHHVQDKRGMLKEAFRVLCPGGRFVLSIICPQEMAGWLYYRYFPEARALDLENFWPPETVKEAMETIGFVAVTVERQHLRYQQDLREWLDTVRRRDSCSQLLTISDAAYEAGVQRLERELTEGHSPMVQEDHICLVAIRGEKRTDITPLRQGDYMRSTVIVWWWVFAVTWLGLVGGCQQTAIDQKTSLGKTSQEVTIAEGSKEVTTATMGKGGTTATMSAVLSQLYREYMSALAQGTHATFKPSNPLVRVSAGRVLIDAVAAEDANRLRADLEALGLDHGTSSGRIVSGWIPINVLEDIAVLPSLHFARPAAATIHSKPVMRTQ